MKDTSERTRGTRPTRATAPSTVRGEAAEPGAQRVFACGLVWSADEPQRVGESLLIPSDADSSVAYVFGRGAAQAGDVAERLDFVRVRPGQIHRMPPVTNPWISRRQLVIKKDAAQSLRVENIGRCKMLVNGVATEAARLRIGDTLALKGQLDSPCA